MKVDIELEWEQEAKIAWDRAREDLVLGISQSLSGVTPYVCAYLFGYKGGEGVLTDMEQAVRKVSLKRLLDQTISDLSDDMGDKDEGYVEHLRASLLALKVVLEEGARRIERLKLTRASPTAPREATQFPEASQGSLRKNERGD